VKNISNLSTAQAQSIIDLCEDYPKLFNSSEIIKFNKAMSFMCFIYKEIYDYIKQKAEDGSLLIGIRKLYTILNNYQEKVNQLEKRI
jgi:hypothetical protein